MPNQLIMDNFTDVILLATVVLLIITLILFLLFDLAKYRHETGDRDGDGDGVGVGREDE
jgi:hypothetical protein